MLIPAVFLCLVSIVAGSRSPHVVHTTPAAAALSAFVTGLVIGVPTFVSGILYARRNPQ
jgi:hypothetical protein